MGTARLIFGPFRDKELLSVLLLYPEPAALVSGDLGKVECRLFPVAPSDDSTSFSSGEPVFLDARIPLRNGEFRLPLNVRASPSRRFLGLEFTELNNTTIDGSAFVVKGAQVVEVLPGLPGPGG